MPRIAPPPSVLPPPPSLPKLPPPLPAPVPAPSPPPQAKLLGTARGAHAIAVIELRGEEYAAGVGETIPELGVVVSVSPEKAVMRQGKKTLIVTNGGTKWSSE